MYPSWTAQWASKFTMVLVHLSFVYMTATLQIIVDLTLKVGKDFTCEHTLVLGGTWLLFHVEIFSVETAHVVVWVLLRINPISMGLIRVSAV